MNYFILIYGKYDTWPYHRRFDSYDAAIEKGISILQKEEYNKIEIWKMSDEIYFIRSYYPGENK